MEAFIKTIGCGTLGDEVSAQSSFLSYLSVFLRSFSRSSCFRISSRASACFFLSSIITTTTPPNIALPRMDEVIHARAIPSRAVVMTCRWRESDKHWFYEGKRKRNQMSGFGCIFQRSIDLLFQRISRILIDFDLLNHHHI